MTIKIEEEKELLTVKPREVPPSQRRNEDVDPIKEDSKEDEMNYDDEILYTTDGQLIFAPSVSEHGVFLMLNQTVLDPRILVQAIEQAEDAYWLDEEAEPATPVHSVDVPKETSNIVEDYCDDCSEPSCLSSSDMRQAPSNKSVRFTEKLISDIRYRPRTLPEDLRTLFYTYEETQRFRQEYRLERRIIERMDGEADKFTQESISLGRANELYDSLQEDNDGQHYVLNDNKQAPHVAADNIVAVCEDEQPHDDTPLCSSSLNYNKCKYDISRVVVMHNDTLKTYDDSSFHVRNSESFTSGNKKLKTSNEDFFDNDSFWSGSITWY